MNVARVLVSERLDTANPRVPKKYGTILGPQLRVRDCGRASQHEKRECREVEQKKESPPRKVLPSFVISADCYPDDAPRPERPGRR